MKYIIKTTFLVPRRDGRWHPAHVRHAGNVGNNFLFNLWRVDSESDPRTLRLGSQRPDGEQCPIAEFWPDVKKIVFKKKPASM